MNTLDIRKPLTVGFGLRAGLARVFGVLFLALEDWRHHSRQRELDAYLGASLNLSDLEHRLREAQYSQVQQGRGFF